MTFRFTTFTQRMVRLMDGFMRILSSGSLSLSRIYRWILRLWYGTRFCYFAGLDSRVKPNQYFFQFYPSIRCYCAWSLGRLHRYLRGFVYRHLVLFVLCSLSLILLYSFWFTSTHHTELGWIFRKGNLLYLMPVIILGGNNASSK